MNCFIVNSLLDPTHDPEFPRTSRLPVKAESFWRGDQFFSSRKKLEAEIPTIEENAMQNQICAAAHRISRTIPNENRAISRSKAHWLSCLCLVVLLASLNVPSAFANAALRYAYVTDPVGAGGQILAYSITPATGVLVPLPCFVTPAPNNPPIAAVVDFTGTWLYTASKVANSVVVYRINPLTGCLGVGVPLGLAPGGIGPVSIGITAHNGCVFTSDSVSGTVDSFVVNPVTGALAVAAGSPFPAGPNPDGLAVDEAGGDYVFVANNVAAGLISGFQVINPGCALAPAPPTPTGAFPVGVAIDPAGQFLAVTNSGPSTLTTYPIIRGGGGVLGGPNPPAPTGAGPSGVAVTPFGDMTFVVNNFGVTVSSFLLNPATGAPAVNGPVHATGLAPEAIAIDWTGTYFYVVNNGGGSVSGYKPNVTTGKPGNAFGVWAAGVAPTAIAIQP